ncbi:MAG: hypothetical protein ACREIA_11125 [Opitutaceae bacterium]
MKNDEIRKLEGCTVLVVPGDAKGENPVVGQRGTIHVSDAAEVSIALEFPAMFFGSVRQQRLVLDDDGVARLLASEVAGNYTFVVPGQIEPPPTEASPG